MPDCSTWQEMPQELPEPVEEGEQHGEVKGRERGANSTGDKRRELTADA